MKLPSIDTLKPPISPSHVATTAAVSLAALLPSISANVRAVVIGGVVIAYTAGECAYSSIKAKRITLPAAAELGILTNDEIDAVRRMRGAK